MDATANNGQAEAARDVPSAPAGVQLCFSRGAFMAIAVLLIGPWLAVIYLFASGAANATRTSTDGDESVAGHAGRWGRLDYTSIRIDLPDEFVYIPPPGHPPIRWFFKGHSQAQAIAFLATTGLAPAQLETLRKAPWGSAEGGVAVTPGDRLVLDLSPAARANIYSLLVEYPENAKQINPVWFRPGQVDERIKGSGLAPESVALLKKLLYPHGDSLLLFTDFEPAARQLPNDCERRRFQKAVCRKKTMLARLQVDQHSDIEAMISYWGAGGRRKDVAPLLQALRHEGDGSINILCLLPTFIRERLYTYPYLTSREHGGTLEDCFWSAMNVFNDPPDDRYNDLQYTHRAIKSEYYGIVTPSQLGDLVFLATRNDAVVHAAAYIADDIVFTKNGTAYIQPWILMHLQEMVDTYTARYPHSGPLKTLYFRRKN